MRGFLAAGDCLEKMSITIPGYTEIAGFRDRFP